ncbi:hypothetical protein LJ655_22505 [Paraburkholderia sp. MMS20-SJTN17]|uniref:Uncharacterized protein n=1 Tax=Paraburkholderia translucens TaxID=2886945 RepID=A0ABS8KIN1_9BURK|nr:hypothetical protein [Paraburkholderia sp. MMS20-SJTN17]MCC8404619.1 hypothetical protein [Paraburkholderia sp. MMS20-SJTN17]
MSENKLAVYLPDTMFNNGEKTCSTSGNTFPVFNPATSAKIAQIPDASEFDIDRVTEGPYLPS